MNVACTEKYGKNGLWHALDSELDRKFQYLHPDPLTTKIWSSVPCPCFCEF